LLLGSTYNTDYAHHAYPSNDTHHSDHANYAHFSYNWVTWRLGAMLLKLPVHE
jgi:hypothetical protein